MNRQTPPLKTRGVTAGVWLALGVLGLIAYHNSFQAPFIWDDPYLITDNYLIRSFSHLPDVFAHQLYYSTAGQSNFYRPLQVVALMADYAVWKLNPVGYHLTSILVHLLCGWLVFLMLRHVFQRPGVAWLVSALFLVHPVNSTVVDYISSRADSLCTLFLLLAYWLFFSSRQPDGRWLSAPGRTVVALAAFVAALLSKELAIIFPLLLIVSLRLWSPTGIARGTRTCAPSGATSRPPTSCCTTVPPPAEGRGAMAGLGDRSYRKTIPFWIVLAVYALIRLTVFAFPAMPQGAATVTLPLRLLTTCESFVRLMGQMVVPRHIHIEKAIPFSAGLLQPSTAFSLLALVAVAGFMRWVRPRSRLCLFGLAWFFVCLAPMTNLVPLNTTFADHWLYLPGIGFLLAVIGGISDWLRARPRPAWITQGLRGAAVIVVAVFVGLTIKQNTIWGDPEQFFRLGLRYSPRSFRAHNELGVIYLNRGQLREAVAEFEAAVRVNPVFDQAHDNLGIAYDHLGELDRAIEAHRKALQLNPNNPKGYNNLGNAYLKLGRFDRAIEAYEAALKLNPHYLSVYNNLGAVYYQQGNWDEARRVWEQGLAIDPRDEALTGNLQVLDAARRGEAPPQ